MGPPHLRAEYAAERAGEEETPEDRDAARIRLMVWYLAAQENCRTASFFGHALEGVLEETPPAPVFDGAKAAKWWCTRELANIKEVVRQATRSSHPDLAWRITVGLAGYDTLCFWTGETDDLRAMALDSAREHGDLLGQAWMLQRVGVAHGMAYRNQEAIAALQAALEVAEKISRRDIALGALRNLAVAHNHARDGAASLAYVRKAVELEPTIADEGLIVVTMAVPHLLKEDFLRAEPMFRRALRIWRDHRNLHNCAVTLSSLGDTLRGLGRREEALAALAEAHGIQEQLGNSGDLAGCLVTTGRTHLHFGDWNEARTCFQQAFDIACEYDLGALIAQAGEGLAEVDRLRAAADCAGG
ncbi:tetratricopeptide repeat protein [Streptomyces sp. SP17BM10]|uniref:tetratricopeptide repeat protein n=1 Tax=Streptomyces sp. SP17BM10 TaxID=3002530 RepID=UPI002E778D29|nr:tetratricopeptide repeat protein [Streptomyces sp. SP17BM10]MEE1782737.1 tetratricopeptide repeat protein [Streptomyces sp. SP17BM10]